MTRTGLYYRYLKLSDLWGRYALLVNQSGNNPQKAFAKSAAYLNSAIELEEDSLIKEEKRREEAGDDD